MTQAPVVLVDGTAYLFRAFHALPSLPTSSGQPTGATRGLLLALRKLKKDYPNSTLIIVFDAPGPTFRDKLSSDYKANRLSMPADLVAQLEQTYALIEAMGLPLLSIRGVEADDVIGTLAAEAVQQRLKVVICTADKDMAQLVNTEVTWHNSAAGELLDAAGVKHKFGVTPAQIIDYLSLVGDAADNVPGVPGVGPKTACNWLAKYGSLDNILAHSEQIQGKVGNSLRAAAEQLALSKKLVTIDRAVNLPEPLTEIATKPADRRALAGWYQRLECNGWLAELTAEDGPPQPPTTPNYRLITDLPRLQQCLADLQKAGLASCYIATGDEHYMQADIIGIALAGEAQESCYIPLARPDLAAAQQLSLAQALPALQGFFADPNLALTGQQLKFGINVLACHGIECKVSISDNSLASYVLNSLAARRHDTEDLARTWLKEEPAISMLSLFGKGAAARTLETISPEAAAGWAVGQAGIGLRLHKHLQAELAQVPAQAAIFTEIETPMLPVLAAMERQGVLIDTAELKTQDMALSTRLDELEAMVWLLAGHEFNLNSPKQLQAVLYDELDLPVLRKTPKGVPSTAEPVLAELAAQDYEIPKLIMEYRSLAKLRSTYTTHLPEQVIASTGRVHTYFHQTVASTGRLSSADPNLQNIPARTETGRLIRQAFVAPKGKHLVAADYSQIELRIMAHFSEDEGLLSAFRQNQDIHQITAADILGIDPADVTPLQRRDAKTINFGLIYGMSAFGLSRQLGIARPAAQQYIDAYFHRYPKVKSYMDGVCKQAKSLGYVETLLGRRLYLPNINAANGQLRQAAERAAINAPMQGTAADIIKKAMIQIDQWLETAGLAATRMILQVHDELLFETDDSELPKLLAGLQTHMTAVVKLQVPLLVNIGTGANWLEAH